MVMHLATLACTMYSVHYTLPAMKRLFGLCTPYTLRRTLYAVHSTPYSIRRSDALNNSTYTVQLAVYTISSV